MRSGFRVIWISSGVTCRISSTQPPLGVVTRGRWPRTRSVGGSPPSWPRVVTEPSVPSPIGSSCWAEPTWRSEFSPVAPETTSAETSGFPGTIPKGPSGSWPRNRVIEVDVGKLLSPSRHEEREESFREERFFLNVVGFGFDVAVVDEAKGARFLRGNSSIRSSPFGSSFVFRGSRRRWRTVRVIPVRPQSSCSP